MNSIILSEKLDLKISPLCFGGNVFGWTLNERDSFRMLDALLDQGINFIDTANNYSHWVPGHVGGESETVLGKWFKTSGKRHQVVLATKVGGNMGDGSKGLQSKYIRASVEASLRRLQTDYIDLYQSHYDDLQTSQEETMAAFNELIHEGKVRCIGASNLEPDRIVSANELARAKGWAPYISVQPLYNIYDRCKFESEYLDVVRSEELAVLSYFSLASGFLSGKYRTEADLEGSQRKDMVKAYLNPRGFRILSALDQVAQQCGVAVAQVATAWLVNQQAVTAPIVSATTAGQLSDLIGGFQLELAPEQLQFLTEESAL